MVSSPSADAPGRSKGSVTLQHCACIDQQHNFVVLFACGIRFDFGLHPAALYCVCVGLTVLLVVFESSQAIGSGKFLAGRPSNSHAALLGDNSGGS